MKKTVLFLSILAICRVAFAFPAWDYTEEEAYEYVTYADFGAVGDGKTDDFAAIIATHEYANKNNVRVRASRDAVYYIGYSAYSSRSAIIQTSTNWLNARFIIDDRDIPVELCTVWVFRVTSAYETVDLSSQITTLSRNQEQIDISLERDALVFVRDNTTRLRRKRFGSDTEWSRHHKIDLFRVDKDGNVDANTPIVWNFDNITHITARPIEEETLYLRGGHFTTIVNPNTEQHNTYFYRGISVQRSNVVIDNIGRDIIDENPQNADGQFFRAPYWAFIEVTGASDVTIRNSQFTGRRRAFHGSYDFLVANAANVTLKNVHQTNSITDPNYWGTMGGNDVKNVTFDNVTMSRFDVHRQVHNVTIIDSEIGHQGVLVTGSGLLHIENTTVRHDHLFISFREDWGSTWRGDVHIINSTFAPSTMADTRNLFVLCVSNPGTFDHNFKSYLPQNVYINGLHIIDRQGSATANSIALFRSAVGIDTEFPATLPQHIEMHNITTESGRDSITVPQFIIDGMNR
jgi:hypothetical protein